MSHREHDEPREPQQAARRARFEREISRLLDRLYGTALRLTRNPDDAEDVVAESVGKAWERLRELRDWETFDGWMFRILNTTFVSLWRRQRSRQERETELEAALGDGGEAEPFSLYRKLHQPFLLWWGTPENQFLDQLMYEDLAKALDALPDAFRVVIVLVEVQGHTYEEVASLLDLPLGTVRSRLSRGRGLLQKALWDYARDTGKGDRRDDRPGPKGVES